MFRLKSISTSLAVLIILHSSCKAPATLAANRKLTIAREVEQALRDNFLAINKEGWVAELKVIDASEDFSWVPPGKFSPVDYDSIRKILIQSGNLFEKVQLEWTELYVKPLSRDLATYNGKYKSEYLWRSGKVSNFTMAEAGVLIRRRSGWKLISGQTFSIK